MKTRRALCPIPLATVFDTVCVPLRLTLFSAISAPFASSDGHRPNLDA